MSKEELVKEILKFGSDWKEEELLKLDNLSLHDILRDFRRQLRDNGKIDPYGK